MDTAQRGSGIDWKTAKDLISRSLKEARSVGGGIACGAGTEQLPPSDATPPAVQVAYQEQCEFVESHGGQIILMASGALARCARGPDDYRQVYSAVLRQTSCPVILHWLGEAFDPALAGYWGASSISEAMDVCLSIIAENPSKVDGIKISLLDSQYEIAMRPRLPPGVRMYTGDDFNYDDLIAGDEHGYSHALLGVFDPLAELAAASVRFLGGGLELALAADLRIAVKSAKFGSPEVTLGMISGWMGIRRLAEMIGVSRARHLTLLGAPITADIALSWGLITAIADDADDFERQLNGWLERLCANGPVAMALTKGVLATAHTDLRHHHASAAAQALHRRLQGRRASVSRETQAGVSK